MIANIGKSLEAFHRRIRPYFSPVHRRAYAELISRGLKDLRDDDRLVVCDFTNPAIDAVGARYYASMVRDFIDAGYYPVIIAHRPTLSSFITSRNKATVLKDRMGVARLLDDLKKPYLYLTDRRTAKPALASEMIRVTYRYRRPQAATDIELPFFVHPQISAQVKLPVAYPVEARRAARIFFGGNTTEGRYNKHVIGKLFKMLTRREMLGAAEKVAAGGISRPDNADSWLASEEPQPFVIFETQRYKIPQKQWIEALTKADFFLACPGVGMPMCHNLIETFAAGTIPILQYADYLPVPLVNHVNALTFKDAAGLRKALETALAMPQEEIVVMRANVLRYYQENYAPGKFSERLFDPRQPEKTLIMNAYRVPRPQLA